MTTPTPPEHDFTPAGARASARAVWRSYLQRYRVNHLAAQAVQDSISLARAAIEEMHTNAGRATWIEMCLTELLRLAKEAVQPAKPPGDPPPPEKVIGHTQEPWRAGH
jgi:hypothetical protein